MVLDQRFLARKSADVPSAAIEICEPRRAEKTCCVCCVARTNKGVERGYRWALLVYLYSLRSLCSLDHSNRRESRRNGESQRYIYLAPQWAHHTGRMRQMVRRWFWEDIATVEWNSYRETITIFGTRLFLCNNRVDVERRIHLRKREIRITVNGESRVVTLINWNLHSSEFVFHVSVRLSKWLILCGMVSLRCERGVDREDAGQRYHRARFGSLYFLRLIDSLE